VLDVFLASLTTKQHALVHEILSQEKHQKLWDRMGRREASFTAGPLLWLTQFTMTEDQHWMAKGTEAVAPFPSLSYFATVMQYLLSEPTLFIIKSREMMTSWLVCGYIAWMCQWHPHIFWVIQTDKEDKVVSLVNYCRILWRRQPEWMKRRCPLVIDNLTEISYGNGSRVIGVPKGENQIRVHHPYGYMSDEAAFQPEFAQCFNAVRPVARQIVAVSSDEMGPFHDQCKLIA
jgi:hypothetical protein